MTTFGYFLSSEELTPKELVDTAQQAAAAGFDRVWISDHYHPWLEEQGQSAFVWTVLGAIAATTELRMSTGVTCPTYRIHPAVMAQAAATTASLAPGRFLFGVGSGENLNEHILGDAWQSTEVRLERLEEAIEIMRKLWTGETVNHRGRHYTVDRARIFSLPDEPPPILVSGFGPEATELAARVGDGWVNTSPDRELFEHYRKSGGRGITQAGTKICWAKTEDEAAETAHRLWGHQAVGGQTSQELPTWTDFAACRDAGSPEQSKSSVPCGPDADRAAAAIQEYVDVGFDEIYVSQMGPDQAGGIRFLTEEVLPRVQTGEGKERKTA